MDIGEGGDSRGTHGGSPLHSLATNADRFSKHSSLLQAWTAEMRNQREDELDDVRGIRMNA